MSGNGIQARLQTVCPDQLPRGSDEMDYGYHVQRKRSVHQASTDRTRANARADSDLQPSSDQHEARAAA
jgi:hypothetical protein